MCFGTADLCNIDNLSYLKTRVFGGMYVSLAEADWYTKNGMDRQILEKWPLHASLLIQPTQVSPQKVHCCCKSPIRNQADSVTFIKYVRIAKRDTKYVFGHLQRIEKYPHVSPADKQVTKKRQKCINVSLWNCRL